MKKTHYICQGRCHADISEEQYNEGLVVCGNNTCDRKGEAFEKIITCDICNASIQDGEIHTHK